MLVRGAQFYVETGLANRSECAGDGLADAYPAGQQRSRRNADGQVFRESYEVRLGPASLGSRLSVILGPAPDPAPISPPVPLPCRCRLFYLRVVAWSRSARTISAAWRAKGMTLRRKPTISCVGGRNVRRAGVEPARVARPCRGRSGGDRLHPRALRRLRAEVFDRYVKCDYDSAALFPFKHVRAFRRQSGILPTDVRSH